MERLQCLLYGLAYFIPLSLFAFYPLRYFTRFKMKTAFILNLCYAIPDLLIFYLTIEYFQQYFYISAILLLLINLSAYALLYTINPWRILFNFLLIVNIGNFLVMFSNYLSATLFQSTTMFGFQWIDLICVLISEAIFLIPAFLFLKHYSDSMIRNSAYDYICRLA